MRLQFRLGVFQLLKLPDTLQQGSQVAEDAGEGSVPEGEDGENESVYGIEAGMGVVEVLVEDGLADRFAEGFDLIGVVGLD